MRSAEGARASGAVGARSPQPEENASAHTTSATSKQRAAFIGLPSPLGRREFGGERGTAGTADSVPHKMHTTGPRLSEDDHARRLPFLSVLVVPSIFDKTRVVKYPG